MHKTYIETKHENRDRSRPIGNGIGWLFINTPSYLEKKINVEFHFLLIHVLR